MAAIQTLNIKICPEVTDFYNDMKATGKQVENTIKAMSDQCPTKK